MKLLFLFLLLLINRSTQIKQKLRNKLKLKSKQLGSALPGFWCWTKPAETKMLKNWDYSIGGPNWGFCSDPEEALNEKVEYKASIITSNIDGAGAKGAFDL